MEKVQKMFTMHNSRGVQYRIGQKFMISGEVFSKIRTEGKIVEIVWISNSGEYFKVSGEVTNKSFSIENLQSHPTLFLDGLYLTPIN